MHARKHWGWTPTGHTALTKLFSQWRVSTSTGAEVCLEDPRLFSGAAGAHRNSIFGFVLEGCSTEAPVSRQRSAGEDRPQYRVRPGVVVLRAKVRQIPKGKRPDDKHVDAYYGQHRSHANSNRQHARRQAFKQQHGPVLIGRVRLPGRTSGPRSFDNWRH